MEKQQAKFSLWAINTQDNITRNLLEIMAGFKIAQDRLRSWKMCMTIPKGSVSINRSLILFCDHLTFWKSGAIDTSFKTAVSPILENLFAYLQVLNT